MNYKDYQEASKRTFPKGHDLNSVTMEVLHCVIGASTETAELLDAMKKHIYYNKLLDVVNVGEEIGDIMWYLSNLCRLLGLDMDLILEQNINKLKVRYPDKFSTENAINRNLNEERKTLE